MPNGHYILLDSSICAKYGENGSAMAGFDTQLVGRQLAYILRGETEFKNFKMNRISAGVTITVLGGNIAAGVNIEDQITVSKRVALAGSAGAVMSRDDDTAYGANFEVCLRSKDVQHQFTLGLSLMRWKDDMGMMASLQSSLQSQFSKESFGVGMKRSGQITIKMRSPEL